MPTSTRRRRPAVAWVRAGAALAVAAGCLLTAVTPASASPPPRPYTGTVFSIGDSVMMGARSCLEPRGFRVDALGSRQIAAGTSVLSRMKDSLPSRVVVHLGTNGGAYPEDFDRIVRLLGRDRIIVFVTIQLPNNYSRYTFEERTNAAIRALPQRHRNVRVFDWNAFSNTRPHLFWSDGFHVRPRGCESYAKKLDKIVRAP